MNWNYIGKKTGPKSISSIYNNKDSKDLLANMKKEYEPFGHELRALTSVHKLFTSQDHELILKQIITTDKTIHSFYIRYFF